MSVPCPLCGPVTIRTLPFRYRFRDRDLRGVSCTGCSLVFLDPMPSDEEIASLYSEAYFTECTESSGAHGPAPYMEMVEDTGPQRARAARRMDALLGRLLGRKGRFFEIGCGPGYFLAEMRDLGWTVGGLEISEFAVREARETQRVDVRRGALIPGSLVPASEDVIFLGDVLEHLPRPLEALREVHAGLVPDGLVVIAVPSTLNLLSGRLGLLLYDRLGRVKTLRIPPYHLFEYTPQTLPRMLEAAGFDLLHLRQSTVPLKRMGLRGSAFENLAKASLQVLALATSRLFNRGGDRLLAVARRRG